MQTKTYSVSGIHCGHCDRRGDARTRARQRRSDRRGRPRHQARHRPRRWPRDAALARRSTRPATRRREPLTTRPRARRVRLEIEGMTCAGCASRVERKLNELDSVDATVNLATESARVRFDPARVQLDDLVGAVDGDRVRRALRRRACETTRRPGRAAARSSAALLTAPLVALDAAPTPVRRLGVARVRARDAGRPLGRLAVPPRGAAERAPRRGHDGHADLDRDARRLGWSVVALVALGTGETYFEVGASHHDADPARPLARVERATPVGRGDPRADRARSERGARAPRRSGGRRPHRRARGRRPLRRATRARRSRPTASSRRASPRSTSRC